MKKVAQETWGCRYEPISAEYDGTGEQADVWLLYDEDYAEFSLRLLDSPNRVRILGSLDEWDTIDDIIDFVLDTCEDYGIFVRAGYFELTKLIDKVTNNRVGKKVMKKAYTLFPDEYVIAFTIKEFINHASRSDIMVFAPSSTLHVMNGKNVRINNYPEFFIDTFSVNINDCFLEGGTPTTTFDITITEIETQRSVSVFDMDNIIDAARELKKKWDND